MNIISRAAVCLLSAVMLLSCCLSAAPAYAEENEYEPEGGFTWTDEELNDILPCAQDYVTYDDEKYHLDVNKERTLKITNNTNSKEMNLDYSLQATLVLSRYDYEACDYYYYLPLYQYIKRVEFDDNIETLIIDSGAFFNFCSLKEIEFPTSLKKIQINDRAFYHTPLQSLEIVADECSIAMSAFLTCDDLKNVYIDSKDTKIASAAFKSCASLVCAALNNAAIEEKAFQNCPELRVVELNGNTSLGQYAFSKCSNLINLTYDPQTTEFNNSFCDCPMLRFINGNPVSDDITGEIDSEFKELILSKFKGTYNIGFITDYILSEVKRVVNEYTTEDMSDMQKAKALHDWLCNKLSYNKNDKDLKAINHSDEAAFLNDTTQCEGYARAYNLLLNAAGISTCFVNSSTHAWNVAKIDGHYFHIDTTWDDYNNDMTYDWFMKSDQQFIDAGGDHASWAMKLPSDLHSFQLKKLPPCPNPVGDVNVDGKLNIADLVSMNRYILGNGTIDPDDMVLADLDLDGSVDAFDMCMLRQKLI
ncbi:MAG: leucine-rich repeat protein [Ruminococcus sp.]|nr:leucine-rich repeat protein [Ruminococcus sp.]